MNPYTLYVHPLTSLSSCPNPSYPRPVPPSRLHSWTCSPLNAVARPCLARLSKDLSRAKQRYDGVARPLGRSVLCIDALLAATSMIVTMRGNRAKEGAAAEAWLMWLGSEEYLQLAMLADASDEGTRFIRQLDASNLDEGEAPVLVRCMGGWMWGVVGSRQDLIRSCVVAPLRNDIHATQHIVLDAFISGHVRNRPSGFTLGLASNILLGPPSAQAIP